MTTSTISTSIDPRTDPRIVDYVEGVLSGRLIVSNKVRQAVEIFAADLDRQGAADFPWIWDGELASKPIRFAEKFMRPTGDYDRFEFLPWECFVLGNIFGWVDPATGLRKHRKARIIVASGNGKTPLAAGIALYCVSQDGVRNPEVDVFANSREQASILVGDCAAMVEESPQLRSRFKTLTTRINYFARGWQGRGRMPVPDGVIRAFSSDARKLDGLRPTVAVFDEVHEMRDYNLVAQMQRSLVKASNPLMVMISTMGKVLDGVLVSEYRLADERLKGLGTNDPRVFDFVAELDESDSYDDESAWIKPNPSLGVLLKLPDLREAWASAQKVPALKSDFLNKRLNLFTKVDEASYLDWELVERNQDMIDLESIKGREAYAGFDISASGDHTSVALEIPLDDGRMFVLPHTFVPRTVAERDSERLPYYEYAMAGLLTVIDGEYIRQEHVLDWFQKMSEIYDIRAIGYDPANATLLVRALTSYRGEGSTVFDCDAVRQGAITLNAPMKDLRERFMDGKIVTNQNRLFEWYLNNVKLRKDYIDRGNENWVPVKADRYRKIDAFMALLDAHTVWMRRCPALGAEVPDAGVAVINLPTI